MTEFSFDEWAQLYETDPDAFERKRADLLEEVIRSAPVEHRAKLRMLQMECDGIRQVMSPMEATVEMTRMATAKLQELKTPLTQLRAACEDIVNLE